MFALKKLNGDKRMQSINSIKTFAYGTSKDLVSDKEEFKCNNIIKRYKKWLTLMMIKQISVIQIGQKFLILHTEY